MTAFTIPPKFVIHFRGHLYIGYNDTGMMMIEGEEECIEWWVGHMSIVTRRRLAPICQIIRTMAAQCQWQHTGSTMPQYLLSHKKFARVFRRTKSRGQHAHFNAVTEQYQCKLYYVNVRIRLDCPSFLAIASLYLRRAGAHTILHERTQNLSHG